MCRPHVHVLRIAVALALALAADLHQKLPLPGELQKVMVGLAVAADPHVAFRIDVDAVFALGSTVTRAGTAPALDEVAAFIELEARRGGLAFLVGRPS
jgi:hypothetical protein